MVNEVLKDNDVRNDDAPASALVITSMPQQLRAKDSRDDWTGVTSTAERRKRQNRIHQRAYREKKREQLRRHPPPSSVARPVEEAASHYLPAVYDAAPGAHCAQATAAPEGYLLLPTAESRAAWRRFTQRAYQDFESGAPRLDHLNILVKINVLAAFAHNAALLGFGLEGLCSPHLVSPFNQQGLGVLETLAPPLACPGWLQPTALQVTVRHHPWIDLIPVPRLRDNILRTLKDGSHDNSPLAMDILDVRDQRSEAACLVIWGESWDPSGWEVSLPFLRKWGGVLEGCPEMIEATNAWRQKRGETRIRFDHQQDISGASSKRFGGSCDGDRE